MYRTAPEIDSDYDAGSAAYEALVNGRALQSGVQFQCGAGNIPGQQELPRVLVAGTFAGAGLPRARSAPRRPVNPAGVGCLDGISCGLGVTRRDPRFEPGPHAMYPGRDAIWAHGGHAGGPTFGALTPARFFQDGPWDARIVRGMGGGLPPARQPQWR